MEFYIIAVLIQLVTTGSLFLKKRIWPLVYVLIGLCDLSTAFFWAERRSALNVTLVVSGIIWTVIGSYRLKSRKTIGALMIIPFALSMYFKLAGNQFTSDKLSSFFQTIGFLIMIPANIHRMHEANPGVSKKRIIFYFIGTAISTVLILFTWDFFFGKEHDDLKIFTAFICPTIFFIIVFFMSSLRHKRQSKLYENTEIDSK